MTGCLLRKEEFNTEPHKAGVVAISLVELMSSKLLWQLLVKLVLDDRKNKERACGNSVVATSTTVS